MIYASIVQWIECQIPVLMIAVRIRMGVLIKKKYFTQNWRKPQQSNFNPILFQCSALNVGIFFIKFVPRSVPCTSPEKRTPLRKRT